MKVLKYIIKRNGKRTEFKEEKLMNGIKASLSKQGLSIEEVTQYAAEVMSKLEDHFSRLGFDCTTAEALQQATVTALKSLSNSKVGETASTEFLTYASKRKESRELQALKHALHELTFSSAKDNDTKRENANIDGDTAMGTMLKYGSESAKSFNLSEMIDPEIAEAHISGDIHIHDLDFYSLTETCCQINLLKLFKGGFSTGHGYLREPGGIQTAGSLSCIAIQSNQNDQHGGQSVPCFDFYLAPYVTKTMYKEIKRCLTDTLDDKAPETCVPELVNLSMKVFDNYLAEGKSLLDEVTLVEIIPELQEILCPYLADSAIMKLLKRAATYTDKATYQSMEALVHNLNTMNSRAGAQVKFVA